jgi:filamentous hemagglutinin family protein
VRGKNLFHSFERFGVEGGGKVTFTGPSGLDNVVSRVTGGEPSAINGTLASTVPGADVWLVNPAGIVFGPGATLDVPGSFHASTADELRFSDGVAFSASDPGRGGLSVARPEAFGFLGAGKPAAITAQGAAFPIDAGEAISLVGGDVLLLGSQISGSVSSVTLAGLGGPGAIDVVAGTVEGDASATSRSAPRSSSPPARAAGKVLVRAGTPRAGRGTAFKRTGDQDTARGTID